MNYNNLEKYATYQNLKLLYDMKDDDWKIEVLNNWIEQKGIIYVWKESVDMVRKIYKKTKKIKEFDILLEKIIESSEKNEK